MTDNLTVYTVSGFHEEVLNALYKLQQSQNCCDLTLKAKDGQTKIHSIIMLASSKFFQQWYNSQDDKSSLNFLIPELTLSELKLVIEYFYTGKLGVTQSTVCMISSLFERLMVEPAVSVCHQFVSGHHPGDDSSRNEVKHSETMKLITMQIEVDSKDSGPSDKAAATSVSDVTGSEKTTVVPVSSFSSNSFADVIDSSPALPSPDLVKMEKTDNGKADGELESGGRRTILKRKRANKLKTSAPKMNRIHHKSNQMSTTKRQSKCKGRGKTEVRKSKRKRNVKQEEIKLEDEESDADTTFDDTKKKFDSESEEERTEHVIKKTSKKGFSQMAKKKPYQYRCKKRLYPCEYCGYVAREKIGLAGHQKSKHQVPFDASRFTVLRCKDCSFETLVMKRLEKHMAKHTQERPNICEHCGKTFKLQGELNAHVKIHLDPTKFQCTQCNRTFSSPYTLKDHVDNIHLGLKNKQYLCHLCSHTTCDTVKLNQHLYNAHKIMPPSNIKTFKCEDCDFIAFRRFAFINHRKLHEGQRDFQCGVCGKGYITARALRHHMIWHSEKKFACQFEACRYASPSKRQLDQHIRLMHTERDVKPFACHLCPHRTGVRGNLDKHLRTVHRLDIPDKRKYSHLYMLGRSSKNKLEAAPAQQAGESENSTLYQTSSQSQAVQMELSASNNIVKTPTVPTVAAAVQEISCDPAAFAQYMSYFQSME